MVNRLLQFWSKEHSLTTFLVILLINLFVVSPADLAGAKIAFVMEAVYFFLLLTGLLTLRQGKALPWLAVLFFIVILTLRWAHLIFKGAGLGPMNAISTAFFLITMLAVLVSQVNRPGPVNAHRIRGAVATYLVLAVLFAYLYAVTAYFVPSSFQVPASWPGELRERGEAFFYFSVVTLTTVGFGDVTPVHPIARTLVMVEALIGQLFPAIVIARLVSLEIMARR